MTVQIDGWWLNNLKNYGARAVLIEDKSTAFNRYTYVLTEVGRLIQQHNN